MSQATTAPERADRADGGADLRKLAWLREELRLSLEQAHKSLRRYLRESLNRAEADIVDPAILRAARQALHQAAGALELIGQSAAARLLGAAEAAVVRFTADGALVTAETVGSIERGSFALLDYLAHVLAGKRVSTLALFPQYRALQELARADRIHPADLWSLNWRWVSLPDEPGVEPQRVDGTTRAQLEALMLSLMRQPDRQTLTRLSELSASLGAGTRGDESTLWKLASAFFEAQSAGALRPDVYAKRIAPRLLALGRAGQASPAVQQQLARDLLFFCAQAQPARATRPLPRLEAARAAFDLGHEPIQDYENPRLGRFDPMWITQARRRLGAARDIWAAIGGGELHHLPSLAEQFALVGDSLQRLLPDGAALAEALATAVRQPVDTDGPPAPALAMEVATLLLVLEATLEAVDLDHPQWPQRVAAIVRRLQRCTEPGAVDEAPEPWMGEVYRAVSDRRTALAAAQELRLTLGEVEKQLDQFVRQPAQTDLLEATQPGLRTVQGVLAMMKLDDAAAGVAALAAQALALERGEVMPDSPPGQASLEAMAGNLGALGMLVDVLAVQPQAARALLRFDAETGELVLRMPEAPVRAAAFETSPGVDAREEGLPVEPLAGTPAEPPAESPTPVAPAVAAAPVLEAEPVEVSGFAPTQEFAETQSLAEALEPAEVVEAAELAELAELAEPVEPAKLAMPVELPVEVSLEPPSEPPSEPPPAAPVETSSLPVLEQLLEPEESVPPAFAPPPGGSGLLTLPDLPDQPELPVLTEAITQPVPIDEAPLPWDDEEFAGTLPVPMVEELGAGPLDDFAGLLQPGSGPSADALKVVGPLTLEIGAFNRFLNDADEAVRELAVRLGEWSVEPGGSPDARCVELAQVIAARAARIGQRELAQVGDALAGALARMRAVEPSIQDEPAMLAASVEHLQRLLHLFAAGFYEPADPALVRRLLDYQPRAAPPDARASAPASQLADDPDSELFPVFEEEAEELLAELRQGLASWVRQPTNAQAAATCMRALHTLKGGARLAGAMRLGERAHRLESRLEHVLPGGEVGQASALFLEVDGLYAAFDELRARLRAPVEPRVEPAAPAPAPAPEPSATATPLEEAETVEAPEPPPALPAAGLGEPLPEPEAAAFPEPLPEPEAAALPEPMELVQAVEILEGIEVSEPVEIAQVIEVTPSLEVSEPLELPEVFELADLLQPSEVLTPAGLPEPLRAAEPLEPLEPVPQLEAPYVEWPAEEEAAAALPAPGPLEPDSSFPELAWPELAAAAPGPEPEPELELVPLVPLVPLTPAIELPLAPAPAPEAEAEAEAEGVQPAAPTLAPVAPSVAAPVPPAVAPAPVPPVAPAPVPVPPVAPAAPATVPEAPALGRTAVPMRAMVRVRAELMDRLFNQAGEVGTARSTIESEVTRLKGSLADLADNLERLRRQLRDLESHSEARAPRARPGPVTGEPQFDPLELDRYTRFQELVRMMAESLDDVATIQRGLTVGVQGAEDGLAAQAQAARGLMDDLLRTRLVEFESIADRLHRVARQAARETGRQVSLQLDGASIELDRGVLDRMGAPFEHLVRNCVVHGIEPPAQRGAAGKPAMGMVHIALEQEGNEVVITVDDDGRGLDYAAIRARALDTGLIGPDDDPDDAALAELVFSPGLSTARGVTELAGRGIGLDVVRAEVLALGGRIELTSRAGQGAKVRITLPLTTAITQAVLLRLGDATVAVPSTIVEIVRRVTPGDIERACDSGTLPDGEAGGTIPFYWLGALLDGPARPSVVGRAPRVVVLRSATQRMALFVDDILGHQEVVVKNLGPQLARLPGLAGMTVLANGEMVPIYNPVGLAAMHGLQARERQRVAAAEGGEPAVTSEPSGPLVLVVDDSLTVRKVTQRLLLREGYRTAVAKDGLEALERIAEEKPAIVLSDLEMPRMDGFDLVRNLRADPRFADLPVVIITSRIAQKHRDHAVALGVDHYLGKPFVERELLELVARHTGFPASR